MRTVLTAFGALAFVCASAMAETKPAGGTSTSASGGKSTTGTMNSSGSTSSTAKSSPTTTSQPAAHSEPARDTMVTSSATLDRSHNSPLQFDDANPQPLHTMDFRLRSGYVTNSFGGDDDINLGFRWVWGVFENAEIALDLPVNLGDGGKAASNEDGNADLGAEFFYRFLKEGNGGDWVPALGLRTSLRTPTGDHSNGVDAEFRAVATKTLVGDLRGHLNAFLTTVSADHDPSLPAQYDEWGYEKVDTRHFQWGFVGGIDAPITSNKDVWIFADYMLRSSTHYGNADMNIAEAGVAWNLDDANALHFTTQVGLDDNGDTPNYGAIIQYSYTLKLQ